MPAAALAAAFPDLLSPEAPSADTVPAEALRPIAVQVALELPQFPQRDPRHRLPPPLRQFAGMRQQVLLQDRLLRQMVSVLWRFRDHPYVAEVRLYWADQHGNTFDAWVADPEGFTFPALLDAAHEDAERLAVLASFLWAFRIDLAPSVSWAFKVVCALVRRIAEPPNFTGPSREATHREAVDGTDIRPAQDQQAQLQAEVRELRSQRRQLHDQAERNESDLRGLGERVAASERNLVAITDELNRIKESLASERHNHRQTRSALATAERQRDSLQHQLADALDEMRIGEEQKLSLSSKLDAARSTVTELEALLAALPRAEEQVLAYLNDERRRVDEDLLLLQGGDALEAARRKSQLRKLRDAYLEYKPEFIAPRPALAVPPRPLRYYALGGGVEVGASAYAIELAGKRLLVDCGIRVGKGLGELAPALERLRGPVDALILTHAHTDHTGWCLETPRAGRAS